MAPYANIVFFGVWQTPRHNHHFWRLYYSFLHDETPVMDFSRGSGFGMHDLIEYLCPVSEKEDTFYCSEVFSGLIVIHAMGIVHLDIKPENILLSNTGHAMISVAFSTETLLVM